MDTIEWLETIGGDASLRYAQAGELKDVLEQAQAPGMLTAAAAAGGGALLREAFGFNLAPQSSQTPTHFPGREDEDDEELPGDTREARNVLQA